MFDDDFCVYYIDKFAILLYDYFRLAVMAQSVAHLIGSEEVTGSIPVNSLKKKLEIYLKISSFFIT